MPQGRIILKRICQSKKLADLKTDGARLLYTWLIPSLDINGCFSGDPDVIKGQIFTRLKKSAKIIGSYLEDLATVGLIVWYESGGDQFLQVPDFAEKQPSLNPSKEAESTIPTPTQEQLRSNSRLTLPKVKQSKVKQSKTISEFDIFWKAYPKKVDKKDSLAWWKQNKPDEALLQTMLAAIEQQKKSEKWTKDGGKYIISPWRWLKRELWADEVSATVPKRRPASEVVEEFNRKQQEFRDEQHRSQ